MSIDKGVSTRQRQERACNSGTAGIEGEMLVVTEFRMRFELSVWGGASF